MERAERAVKLKHSGYNCCQAVTAACADLAGADPGPMALMGAGFGGGMGCMEATCGALVGAVMVEGVRRRGRAVPPAARTLLKDFEKRCGATLCKDLKGRDTGTPLCSCDDCVRNAVYALCEHAD